MIIYSCTDLFLNNIDIIIMLILFFSSNLHIQILIIKTPTINLQDILKQVTNMDITVFNKMPSTSEENAKLTREMCSITDCLC